jgi:NADP-dependent 3-hydroxy acid dehydrogenase YdfG
MPNFITRQLVKTRITFRIVSIQTNHASTDGVTIWEVRQRTIRASKQSSLDGQRLQGVMLNHCFGIRMHGLHSKLTPIMNSTLKPVSELLSLENRVVLVTGSSSGIGVGIAKRLHEAGASVAIHCSNNRAGAEAVAKELKNRVYIVQGDVQRDAQRLCDEVVATFGKLDALVNNAGIQPVKMLLEQTPEDIQEMLRVNVEGVMTLTKVAATQIIKQGNGGAIINISSIEGLQPALGHSHYTTSKAAVLMHTRSSALELGRHGIRVNAVLEFRVQNF